MARINVEQKALIDPRFQVLGSRFNPLATATREMVDRAFGLYLMAQVWNYCIERELLVVRAQDLEAIYRGLTDAIIDAQLGELVITPPGVSECETTTTNCAPVSETHVTLVRIKGGEGRLDYLSKARNNGRKNGPKGAEHGSKGGRPRKNPITPKGVSKKPPRGISENPPPAPAPAPALKEDTPTLRASFGELSEYLKEIGSTVDPQKFLDHYDAVGWVVNGQPIADWRALARKWASNESARAQAARSSGKRPTVEEALALAKANIFKTPPECKK